MSIKNIIRVAAIGALAAMPAAAPASVDEEVNFTAWSGADCGTDKSKAAEELSTELTAWKTTADTIKCTKNSVGLNSWPQKNGKYELFVDTTKIHGDCQLIFFESLGSERESSCLLPYRSMQPSSGCAAVALPHKYDLAYCCGPDCAGALPSEKKREASEELGAALLNATGTSLAQPVAQVQGKEKREACSFNRTPKGLRKIYRRPKKTSATVDCPSDAKIDCNISGTYTTANTIGDTKSDSTQMTAGAAWVVEASIAHTEGKSHEISRAETYSRQYTLSISPGSSGYLIFTPQYTCGEGTFEGDDCGEAAVKAGSREWCVPSLIKGENGTMPDGRWGVLKTN